MRRRPFPPPTERQRLDLEPAMRLYCEKRKIDFGVLTRALDRKLRELGWLE
jgi:hypothetical protein